ncbi:MAG: xanthine dehydrogenase family protein molybdopterin-binding subunit [Sulfolobaceae archaeon]|nr:xanthine dehydrogenase family protein molybdopterin-binding subunit [Sulfolobaceae archaeon]
MTRYIGKPIKRIEDPRLITGRGRYVDDIILPGMQYLYVIRSNYAWAKFRLDTTEAEKRGAIVITPSVVKDLDLKPLPNFFYDKAPKEYALPIDYEAKYFGEPIALVLGNDRYEAADLAELVNVEYEPYTPLVDPIAAIQPNAPVLHKDLGTNLVYTDEFVYGEEPESFDYIEKKIRYNRVSHGFLEPNAVIADYDKFSNRLTVYANTQVPQVFKTALSIIFNLPRSSVRILVPDIGGAFGGKIFLKPLVLASLASIVSGRPVKYIETRIENISAAVHGPDRRYTAKLLYKGDKLIGVDVELIEDFGAYMHTYQPLPVLRQIYHLTGAYDMKFLRFKIKGVVTNKPPTGAWRGLGLPPAVLVLENLVDSLARKLMIKPYELRKKNFITKFPATTITGAIYDSGNYIAAMEKAVELLQPERIKEPGKLRGVGYAFVVEPGSSLGFQNLIVKKPRTPYYEGVYMRMDSGGEVSVFISSGSIGTGHETTIAQVVADVLGIDINDVRVNLGDTEGPPGTGVYGSRFSVVTLSAVYEAAIRLREKIRTYVAKMYNVEVNEVKIEDGKVYVKGNSIPIQQAVNWIYNRSYMLENNEIGVDVSVTLNSPNITLADDKRRVNFSTTYGVSVHAAAIEIDKDTGFIKVLKYVVVSDAGNIINPLIVDGQIIGGTIMGIGTALYEVIRYDENGIPQQTSFSDYWIPSALEAPNINIAHLVTPSPLTPLGTKGVAEGSALGPAAAIVNALEDALGITLNEVEIPITPDYVLSLIQKVQGSS